MTAGPAPRIRSAVPADAPGLGRLHVRVWQQAYAGLMPADFLAGLDPVARGGAWSRRLAEPPPGLVIRVADPGGPAGADPIGFAVAGPTRDDPPDPSRELYAIYLDPAHQGSGLADDLLAAVLPVGPASLWVLAGNERAIAFYRRHGFALTDARKEHPPTGAMEHRMVR